MVVRVDRHLSLLGRSALVVVLLAATVALAAAGQAPIVLGPVHEHPSGAFSFRAPQDWKVEKAADDPDAIDAVSPEGVLVRLVYRRGDVGYDALHGLCMAQSFPGHREADPKREYEYDYVEGNHGVQRTLDSAFVVEYDSPIQGYTKWRQRNLTMVGGGHSLCLITFAPVRVWKKSPRARAGETALLANVKFRE